MSEEHGLPDLWVHFVGYSTRGSNRPRDRASLIRMSMTAFNTMCQRCGVATSVPGEVDVVFKEAWAAAQGLRTNPPGTYPGKRDPVITAASQGPLDRPLLGPLQLVRGVQRPSTTTASSLP